MSALIKLAAYLIGAIALLTALIEPSQPTTTRTQIIATSTTPVATTSPKVAEKKLPAPEKKVEPSFPRKVQPLSPKKPALSEPIFVTPLPLPTPVIPLPPPPPATATPPLSWSEINKRTRAALVNIICTTIRSGSFEPTSGSGVVIDPRGLILTNAHVAEYFLLKDYLTPDFVQCVIRTGEPARNRYRARLLYLSPLWLQANYQKIRLAEPTGTGEHDFALLLITESVNAEASPLPTIYPFLPLDFTNEMLHARNQALVAGYPAGLLSGINIQKEFYPSSSVVTTGQVLTFHEKTADVFSIGGSPLAQEGSSGGAVVSSEGKLIGLIVTASAAATTGGRDLHAITPSHIAASFREDTGSDIKDLLASDLAATAQSFNENVAPALTNLLESALQKK